MEERTTQLAITVDYILGKLKNIAENYEAINPNASIEALELMGKYLGMFNQREDVSGNGQDDFVRNAYSEAAESGKIEGGALTR